MLSYELVLIASVIDKVQMREKYQEPQSPSSLAYRMAIERIEKFLQAQSQMCTACRSAGSTTQTWGSVRHRVLAQGFRTTGSWVMFSPRTTTVTSAT